MKLLTLLLISQSLAAPAVVTVFQTVTENTPSPTLAAASNNVQQSATQTAVASTTTGSWLSNLLNDIQSASSSSSSSGTSFWDSLFGSSTSSSSTTSSTSSGSSSSNFLDLLKGIFGSPSSSTASSSSSSSPLSTIAVSQPATVSYKGPSSSTTSSYQQPTTLSTSTSPSSSSTSTPATSSSSGDIYAAIDQISGIDKSFATDILNAHNQYRSQHQAGPLSWDVDTYNYAKNNADNYDCSGVLTHTHGQYGENLAAGFKTGPLAVKAWYVEGETYDYSAANEYNHFTQVVWKDSTKVGCAYKDCSSTNWALYVVCEYDPPGNMIGEEAANVLP